MDINLANNHAMAKIIYDNVRKALSKKLPGYSQSNPAMRLLETQSVFDALLDGCSIITPDMWFTMSIYMCWVFDTYISMNEEKFQYVVKKTAAPADRFIPMKYHNKMFKFNVIDNVTKVTFDDLFSYVMCNKVEFIGDDTFSYDFSKPHMPIDYPWLFSTVYRKFKAQPQSGQAQLPLIKQWLGMTYGMMCGYDICSDLTNVTKELKCITESLKTRLEGEYEDVDVLMWNNNDIWFFGDSPIEKIIKSYGDDVPKYIITNVPYLFICNNGIYMEASDIISFSGFEYSWADEGVEMKEALDDATMFKFNNELIKQLKKKSK